MRHRFYIYKYHQSVHFTVFQRRTCVSTRSYHDYYQTKCMVYVNINFCVLRPFHFPTTHSFLFPVLHLKLLHTQTCPHPQISSLTPRASLPFRPHQNVSLFSPSLATCPLLTRSPVITPRCVLPIPARAPHLRQALGPLCHPGGK